MKKYNISLWFTLIEILVWILIFSFVIISWFQVFFFMYSWKENLSYKIELEKESLYFSEKFFEMIKKWWTIDYEEYFNRKVVWNATYIAWHYDKMTWFGNFWSWWVTWTNNFWDAILYHCLSWNWSSMWTWGCYDNNFNNYLGNVLWKPQRIWQYWDQFIDYNSNSDSDGWDQDWVTNKDWAMVWDEDDEYLWEWPSVFVWWTDVKEIYLISWDWNTRTFFRWHVKLDPKAPATATCDLATDKSNPTWPWCLWNIEFLKLDWKDRWIDHVIWWWFWESDWKIDTWLINKDFDPTWWPTIAWIWWIDQYWQPIFPDSVNIANFKVYPYPNSDIKLAWKSKDPSLNVNPYIQIKFDILPSRLNRRKIKWTIRPMQFVTTINLTDIFSK
jgi:hypothetical protein